MTTPPTSPASSPARTFPPGAESPVLWGSVAGVVVSASIAFVSFLSSATAVDDSVWIVAAFACVVGIRYYTSVVFLTYDDFLSGPIAALAAPARRGIFVSQVALILGSSLNISLLTTLGAVASVVVILLQCASTLLYWKPLWSPLTKGADGRFRLFMALGEVAVAACAIHILLRLAGVITNIQGESMLLGAVVMVFITECVTTYTESVAAFWRRTRDYLV